MKLSIKQLRNLFWILISLIWLAILFESKNDTSLDWSNAVRETGELSWRLLVFTIYIGLLRKIFKYSWIKKLCTLRKHAGIFAWLVATSHFIFEFVKRYLYRDTDFINFLQSAFSDDHAMIFGSLAWLIMLPALLTSTNWAVINIGANKWKIIQRLTHVAFVFAGLHFALISYFSYQHINLQPIILLSIYIIAYIALFIHKKRSHE